MPAHDWFCKLDELRADGSQLAGHSTPLSTRYSPVAGRLRCHTPPRHHPIAGLAAGLKEGNRLCLLQAMLGTNSVRATGLAAHFAETPIWRSIDVVRAASGLVAMRACI
jgi:hypothetical protein